MALLDDAIGAVKGAYKSVRDKIDSIPADLAARGTIITNVKPSHPADQDIASMAESTARSQGRGDAMKSPLNSTMTPISRKGK